MPAVQPNRRQLLQAALTSGGLLALSQAAEAETRPVPQRESLKITAVKTFHLQCDLKRPFGVSVSVPLDKTRTTLLVKIETDAGLTGWGETSPINGTQAHIAGQLGPKLVGRNPLHYRRLIRELWGANFGNPFAVGALDMALNDVRGKALGLPVAELFGGRLRDKVATYASAMNYVEGEEPEKTFPQEAARLVSEGFKALKMRIGRYSVAREAKIAAAIRDAVGPDVRLMADGNGAYTHATAMQMGAELHKLDFECFEEPLPQSPRYAGYEELRRKLPLSLAGGEALDSRGSAKELLERGTFDIIQPDLSLCSGLAETLFIAEMAALYGVRCYPHCWGSAILIAATVHLVSLIPEAHWGFPTDSPYLEFDQSENPWRKEIVTTPFAVKDGFVAVPTAPGLGIEVNEEAVERYAIES